MTNRICIVPKSKLLGAYAAQIALIAQAVDRQLSTHAAMAWGRRGDWVVTVGTPAPSDFPLYLLDTPDEANALGYHTEDERGRVWGRVFAKPVLEAGGTVLDGALSIAAVVSHEALELWGDPSCNRWADGPGGEAYAIELCDPVEDDAYTIKVSGHAVSVSNFVLPSWFDPHAAGHTDYLGKLSKPFALTKGGYVVVRKDGQERQVFGEHYPAWKRAIKAHAGRRPRRHA